MKKYIYLLKYITGGREGQVFSATSDKEYRVGETIQYGKGVAEVITKEL